MTGAAATVIGERQAAAGGSMRALTLVADRKLELLDVAAPAAPAAGEVQIRIKAIGLNHIDVWGWRGMAFAKRKLPLVVGAEAAGEIRAVGEGHAAPAPDVDVIEADGLDRDLYFAGARRGRRCNIAQLDLAVGDKRERAHRVHRRPGPRFGPESRFGEAGHAGSRAITRQTFCPPKPKELEIARLTHASRATFGTTSSGIAGSATL